MPALHIKENWQRASEIYASTYLSILTINACAKTFTSHHHRNDKRECSDVPTHPVPVCILKNACAS